MRWLSTPAHNPNILSLNKQALTIQKTVASSFDNMANKQLVINIFHSQLNRKIIEEENVITAWCISI